MLDWYSGYSQCRCQQHLEYEMTLANSVLTAFIVNSKMVAKLVFIVQLWASAFAKGNDLGK